MFPEDKDLQLAFENSREQIESFFNGLKSEYNLTEKQKKKLVISVKDLIYFLKLNKSDRVEIEIEFNKESRDENIDKYKRLNKFYTENKDLVDYIAPITEKSRFHKLFKYKIEMLEKSIKDSKKTRSGENKIIVYELQYLFFNLEKFNISRTKQLDIVYKLFKEFKFDDFGASTLPNFNEREYKERIRKHFQTPILKDLLEEELINKHKKPALEKFRKTPKYREMVDIIFGRRPPSEK